MNFLLGALFFSIIQGHGVSMTVVPDRLYPGSPFLVSMSGLVSGTAYDIQFDNRALRFTGSGKATVLLGVDLSHPAGMDHISLSAQGISTPVTSATIRIHRHTYPAQYLKLPKNYVELTPAELQRAEKEQAQLDRLFAVDTMPPLWSGDFIMPLRGIITAPFGGRRFLNGEPRSPHTGIDIAARAGAPVVATNRGIVCFTGNLFFGGNSIIIDHGQGIYSMYFHLDKYAVKNGEQVNKGQIIGYAGNSGRVTGAALHFGVRIMDSKIDPQLLFPLIQQ